MPSDHPNSPQQSGRNWSTENKISVTLPVSLRNSSGQAQDLYARFVAVHQNIQKRNLEETEKDALAAAANKASRNGRIASFGTMIFGVLLPDLIPPFGRFINRGKNLHSLREITRGRGFAYVVRRNFGVRLALFGLASIPAFAMNSVFLLTTMATAIRSDGRLVTFSNEVEEMAHKMQQQQRQKGMQGIPTRMPAGLAPTTQPQWNDGGDQIGAASMNDAALPSKSFPPPNTGFDSIDNPNKESSWDSLLDDDASPVAPAHITTRPGPNSGQSQQPSSWDQIRRRSMAESQSAASHVAGTDQNISQPADKSAGLAQQQQSDRSQAQKEFDALMERERQGNDSRWGR